MRLSVLSLISLSLMLGACSTTPAVQQGPVPSEALLRPCLRPQLQESRDVRGIVNNSNERQAAYDACEARLAALIQWHRDMTGAVLRPVDMGVSGAKSQSPF